MMRIKKILLCLLVAAPLLGRDIQKKEIDVEMRSVSFSVQEYNNLMLEAVEKKNWKEVIKQSQFIIKNFPGTVFFQEAFYFLGYAYFQRQDFDLANQQLSLYLKRHTVLQHMKEAIGLKFEIAEKFREGHGQHIAGVSFFPKWIPARDEAIQIYEEVITAIPNDDLAARSFLGKGDLLLKQGDYVSSLESYETLIQRFPRHPLVPQAYVDMMKVYLMKAKKEYPNHDDLDVAILKLTRFKQDFALNPQLEEAENIFLSVQEVFASHFYELAQFYERMKKPQASILYYTKIVSAFPNTTSARLSKDRLGKIHQQEDKKDEMAS